MEHLRYLESEFLSRKYADIYFAIDNGAKTVEIPAHKVILAAGSLTLANRFSENIALQKIEIQNTTPEAFEEFLFVFYSKFPEKNFTIANTIEVLTLARTFDVAHCFKSMERFLVSSMPTGQVCFGYSLAMEFALVDLKAHCQKQINENKTEIFMTSSFLGCSQGVLHDILDGVTAQDRNDIQIVFEACMNWSEKQCILLSMDSSDMELRRSVLGECFNRIYSIASKDGEFLSYAMNHYAGFFVKDEQQSNADDTNEMAQLSMEMHGVPMHNISAIPEEIFVAEPNLSKDHTTPIDDVSATIVFDGDVNRNESFDASEFARFSETILSPQTWCANDPISIEFQTTKRIALNGIAFSTVSGSPKGTLTVAVRCDGGERILLEQRITSKSKRREPRNFVAIENVVLEPFKDYVIKAVPSKDIIFRSSRRIANSFVTDDFTVTFKCNSRRDTFSHFIFSDFF